MTDADSHLPAAGPATTGLLLAAGEGRRFGMPKALADTGGGRWVLSAARALLDGGCADVLVVTDAAAQQAEGLVTGRRDERLTTTRGRTVPLRVLVHLVDAVGRRGAALGDRGSDPHRARERRR